MGQSTFRHQTNKKAYFPVSSLSGRLDQARTGHPKGPLATVAVPEAPLETPPAPAVPLSLLFFFNAKERRNETICLGRSGMDSRKVVFWVNVKHFTGVFSLCVRVVGLCFKLAIAVIPQHRK